MYTITHSFGTALDLREKIGGEDKIRDYCHRLAREGGRKMAEILGTELQDEEDQFTASMVCILA
jgi:hercynylcysteine S-oxide lyase